MTWPAVSIWWCASIILPAPCTTRRATRFRAVQEITHNIDAHLYTHMPLIPLWQLHSHLAVPPELQVDNLNPVPIFTHVAEWTFTP